MTDLPNSLEFINKTTLENITNSKLKASQIHGIGLFTTQPIKKGDILCVLDGQTLTLSQYQEIQRAYAHSEQKISTYFFMEYNHLSKTVILARPLRTRYSYINHNRKPSLILNQLDFSIIALRDIDSNEELTLDYRQEPLPCAYLLGHGATYL